MTDLQIDPDQPSSIVLPFWLDRPPLEAVEIGINADRCGYHELWIGEMATFDAFALAGAIARDTRTIRLTVGPLPVATRSPVALALGISSIAALAAREVGLALGASNPMIVSGWHERPWQAPVERTKELVPILRRLMAGERVSHHGTYVQLENFKLRAPIAGQITIAAFAPRMLRAAAALADRVVVNLLTVDQIKTVAAGLRAEANRLGRACPPLVAWTPVALEPGNATWAQLRAQIAVYVAAPGYAEMFEAAGFEDVVAAARTARNRHEVAERIPEALIRSVAAIGNRDDVRHRFAEITAAGAEIAAVPATADDPGATRTLTQLQTAFRSLPRPNF